jgi:ParB family chromosome partitioning protein
VSRVSGSARSGPRTLGDARALEELETVAGGGTKEAPVESSMQAAAIEALGRMASKLSTDDIRRRVVDRVEQAIDANDTPAARGRRARSPVDRRRESRDRSSSASPRRRDARDAPVSARRLLGELGDVAAEATLAKSPRALEHDARREARKALEKLFPTIGRASSSSLSGARTTTLAEPAATYLAKEAEPAQLLPRLATLKDENLRFRLTIGLLERPRSRPLISRASSRTIGPPRARTPPSDRGPDELSRGALERACSSDKEVFAKALERRAAHAIAGPRRHGADRSAEATAWREILWAARRVGTPSIAPALRSIVSGGDKAAPPRSDRGRAGPRRVWIRGRRASLTAALKDMDAAVRSAAAASLAKLAPDRAAKDSGLDHPLRSRRVRPHGGPRRPRIERPSSRPPRAAGSRSRPCSRAARPSPSSTWRSPRRTKRRASTPSRRSGTREATPPLRC